MKLVLAASTFAAACATSDRTVLSTRKFYPPGWNLVARADVHNRASFTVALKQTNLDALEAEFWAVSDPTSPKWLEFKSMDEIDQMIAPKPEDVAAVKAWLESGLSKKAQIKMRGDSIQVMATVGEVEELFKTELHLFTHDKGNTVPKAMGEFSIPSTLKDSIDLVAGVTDFAMPYSAKKTPKPDASTPKTTVSPIVIPDSLKAMYKTGAQYGNYTANGISQGVAEFQDDASYNKADLKTFLSQADEKADTVSDIVGPYSGTNPDMEATLDTQYEVGMAEGAEMWYWTTPGWQYEWASNFFSTSKVPDSVSISWGWAEDGQCQSGIAQTECTTLGVDAASYVARTNTEFQKIGLRGVSLFAASGDSGANGRTDGGCTGTTLHASFPGSSPYITAVGATQFQTPEYKLDVNPTACTALGSGYKCASGGLEEAVSSQVAGFTSGGGFSTYTPRPSYQNAAVEGYLSSGVALPPSSYYNNSNRAYPDVAALGNGFAVYLSSYGGWTTVGGTSASSPTFAGVSAYLNALSYEKTGKPLGFLNPLLYKMAADQPSAFTDIVTGDNKCTEDGCASTCKGYECTTGWDPVTGLGTPVASEMLKYVEAQLTKKAVLV